MYPSLPSEFLRPTSSGDFSTQPSHVSCTTFRPLTAQPRRGFTAGFPASRPNYRDALPLRHEPLEDFFRAEKKYQKKNQLSRKFLLAPRSPLVDALKFHPEFQPRDEYHKTLLHEDTCHSPDPALYLLDDVMESRRRNEGKSRAPRVPRIEGLAAALSACSRLA